MKAKKSESRKSEALQIAAEMLGDSEPAAKTSKVLRIVFEAFRSAAVSIADVRM